jgi:hypothetical protein
VDNLDEVVVLLESVNDHLGLRKVSDGLAYFLHNLEGIRIQDLLNQNVDRILSFSNELVKHLDIFVLELCFFFFV